MTDGNNAGVVGALVTLSKDLDLPEGFLTNLLLEESDWSFIVKAQAILETAVTSLLVAHLGRPELEDVIAEHLEMSQRLKMLSALNLCSPEQREMMRRLGNLRNKGRRCQRHHRNGENDRTSPPRCDAGRFGPENAVRADAGRGRTTVSSSVVGSARDLLIADPQVSRDWREHE